MNFLDLVHPEDYALVMRKGLARLRGEERDSDYEIRLLTKTGETILVKVHANLAHLSGKEVLIGNLIDITEDRAHEIALKMQNSIIGHELRNWVQIIIALSD